MLGRLDIVIQSVEDYISERLTTLGLSGWRIADAYPLDDANPLQETLVVVSSSHNDTAKPAECGGSLVFHRRRIMIDIFGRTEAIVQNIVGILTEEAFSPYQRIPYLDYTQQPAVPEDYLGIDNCESARNYFTSPKPWQEHWHTVLLAVGDEYYAAVN